MSARTPDREPGAAGSDGEGFLRRWSRRKREARLEELSAEPPATAASEPRAADREPAPPAPVLTDADMPPIESLTADSDFSGFMSPGVSEALRRQALRVLFRSPGVNTRCPLDSEYYDCANLTPLGATVTHEMREQMEREAKERLAAVSRKAFEGPEATASSGGERDSPAAGGGPDTSKTNEQGGQRDA